MFTFDETALTVALDKLPPLLRAAFAAACAERLLPAYEDYASTSGRGNAAELRSALDGLWRDLEGSHLTPAELEDALSTCMQLIPRENEEPWFDNEVAAQDASIALAHALNCRKTGESQEAVGAAHYCFEALFEHISNRDDVDLNVPGAVATIVADRLVQRELGRQQRDLDELLYAGGGGAQVARLRERARAEAKGVFREAPY